MRVFLTSRKILLTIFISMLLFSLGDAYSQVTKELFGPTVRAAKGDTVWIILNHIKAEKREQFDQFMKFWLDFIEELADAGKLSERELENAKTFRYLTPTRQNKDSTYSYVYMGDPWISGVNTRFLYYLKKKYTDEEATKHYNLWKETLAKPQEGYRFIQTEF